MSQEGNLVIWWLIAVGVQRFPVIIVKHLPRTKSALVEMIHGQPIATNSKLMTTIPPIPAVGYPLARKNPAMHLLIK